MTWYTLGTNMRTSAALGDGDFEIDHLHLQQNCGYFRAREITSETHSPSLSLEGPQSWPGQSSHPIMRIWLPSTRHVRKQKPSGSTAAYFCSRKTTPQAPHSLPWRFHNASDTPPGIFPGRTLEMWRWGLWTGNHNFGIPNGDRVRAENHTTGRFHPLEYSLRQYLVPPLFSIVYLYPHAWIQVSRGPVKLHVKTLRLYLPGFSISWSLNVYVILRIMLWKQPDLVLHLHVFSVCV